MKTLILILICASMGYSSNYYWANGKKVNLKKDSLTLIARKNSPIESSKFSSYTKKLTSRKDKIVFELNEFDKKNINLLKSKYFKEKNSHLGYQYLIDGGDTTYCLNRVSVKIKNDSSYQIINN